MDWVELPQGYLSLRSDGRLLWVPAVVGAHTISLGRMQGRVATGTSITINCNNC